MKVHFDNWGSRYDEDLRFTSNKIYPIRFYSKGYTGQVKCTIRDFDQGLTRKEQIIKGMENYAQTEFKCESIDEIQEMYQFLCGEWYLYLDSMLTCDEKEAKIEAANIIEIITVFFEMLNVWINQVPKYADYYSEMRKFPYLYLVWPEAAILNLSKSFVTTLELIFGKSPRSADFFKSSSSVLNYDKSINIKKKSKGVPTVRIYFLEGFINTKCLSSLRNQWLCDSGSHIDFSTVLGFLSSISYTLNVVEHTNEESIEFLTAVHQYIFQEGGISQKVTSLPENEVKDLDENDVIKVAEDYGPLTGFSKGEGEAMEISEIKLELLNIFLRSPFMEKKLHALNEMKKFISKKENSVRERRLTDDDLNLAMKAINYIFKEAKHPELISRSTEILSILAQNNKLDKETIVLLCETSLNNDKHEAIAGATLTVISDMALTLPVEIIHVFIGETSKLTIDNIDENLVTFLKNFYYNCLVNFKKYKTSKAISMKKMSELFNLEMFWEAIQDECQLSTKVKDMALQALVDLMIALNLSNTSDYLKKAVDSLKLGMSSVRCITLIEKVLKSITSRRDYPVILKTKKDDLIILAIQAAEIYLKNARDNSPMDGSKIEETKFSGNYTHKDFIKKCFNFISYLLKSFEAYNKLTSDHINMMYKVFVKESICEVERKEFYNFFSYDEFEVSTEDRRIVTPKIREYLFEKILCKELTSENTGIDEFKCFETNFFFVNTQLRNLKREMNEQVFRTVSMNLDGLGLVWDFAIFSQDFSIRRKCSDFLADLYLYSEKEDYKKRGKTNTAFLDEWLEKCLTMDESNEVLISNVLKLLFNFVHRYDGHHMNSDYFEKKDFSLEVTMQDLPKNNPNNIRRFRINREMTVGAIRKIVGDFHEIIPSEVLIVSGRAYLTETCMNDKFSAYKECKAINIRRRSKDERESELPRFLSASNLQIIKQIIEKGLLSKNQILRLEALNFLEYIPPNQDRRDKMIKCKKLTKDCDPEQWSVFLYCSSVNSQEIYYGLKIMKSILVPYEKLTEPEEIEVFKDQRKLFFKKFAENDGFSNLVITLENIDAKLIAKDVVWLKIFEMLTNIILLFISNNKFQSLLKQNKGDKLKKVISVLVKRCIEVLEISSNNVDLEREIETMFNLQDSLIRPSKELDIKHLYEKIEADFYHSLFLLLKNCFILYPEEIEQLYVSDCMKGLVINLLVLHPNEQVMVKVAEGISEISKATISFGNIINPIPTNYFFELLKNQLEAVIDRNTLRRNLVFNLLDEIITHLDPNSIDHDASNVEKIVNLIFETIVNRDIIEDDAIMDPILSGCLEILGSFDRLLHDYLTETCPQIYSNDFLTILLSRCLFSRERLDPNDDRISYPLCKHDKTREYALKLISQLFGKTGMLEIATYLEPLLKNGGWRSNKRDKWNFQQHSSDDKRTTHVGLVNLGCTCYMNSLVQQLFMSSHFRTFILDSVDNNVQNVSRADNVLYQTKYLFAILMKLQKPVYNPIALFNSIKEPNGNIMPTNEQRDVDEFLNIFIDKIENGISTPEDKKRLRSIFGGAFAQELICKGCPHRSVKEENFLAVNVELKGKNNIQEGLDLFIQGDMLEGDNAYYCEKCDIKVDTLKRCCFKKLPNTLILALKRFEFDFETLSRYKLNSYCEFGQDLNMKDYCQESLAKKELLKKMKEENLAYELLNDTEKSVYDFELPEIYYNYKLKGVIIHYGTADGGHYYSYINERGTEKWFDFNDTYVRDYNLDDLVEDAYGGKLKHEQKFIQGGRQYVQTEKLNSAYVLIYERDDFIDVDQLFALQETERSRELMSMTDTYKIPLSPLKIEKDILEEVMAANDRHWIASKVFDGAFIDMMTKICIDSCPPLQIEHKTTADLPPAKKFNLKPHSGDMEVDEPDENLFKLKFSFLFLATVTLRSSDRFHFAQMIVPQMRKAIKNSYHFAKWIINVFTQRHTIEEFFINSCVADASRIIAQLIKDALSIVYSYEKVDIVKFINQVKPVILEAPESAPEYILTILSDETTFIPSSLLCLKEFVLIGLSKFDKNELNTSSSMFFLVLYNFAITSEEYRYFLVHFKWHKACLPIMFQNQTSIETVFPTFKLPEENKVDDDMESIESSIKPYSDDDLGKSIIYKLSKMEKAFISNQNKDIDGHFYILKLMSILTRSCQIMKESKSEYSDSPFKMENPEPLDLLNLEEMLMILEPSEQDLDYIFDFKWSLKPFRNELARLYGHLLFDDERSIVFIKSLLVNLNQKEYNSIQNYERVLYTLSTMQDSHFKPRLTHFLELSLKIYEHSKTDHAFFDTFLSTLIKFGRLNLPFRELLYQHTIVDVGNKWIGANPMPPTQSYRTKAVLFRNSKHNHRFSHDCIKDDSNKFLEFSTKRREDLKRMYKKPKWESKAEDSEDDVYDRGLDSGDKVDFVARGHFSWTSGTVVTSLGHNVLVQEDTDEMEIDGEPTSGTQQWMTLEETNLAPYQTKAQSLKALSVFLYDKAYYS